MDQMREDYPLTYMCNVFDIHRQAFYKWEKKGKPIANNFNVEDALIISEEHNRLERKYGVERLTEEIRQHLGIVFNHKKVRRYLRLLGLSCVARVRKPKMNKKSEKKGNHLQMAPNLLDNNFTSERPHHKLSTDVSYIECTDGWLHLSAVKDLFNNQIISYSMSNRNDVDLVIKSIQKIPKGNGIIHSDQGSQYFSISYIHLLAQKGYTRSMSRKGACWENSPIENWFSQLKQEHLYPLGKITKKQARKAIKKYVQWYNTERIQKRLEWLSPINFALQY
jgi:transposase InsO family protein